MSQKQLHLEAYEQKWQQTIVRAASHPDEAKFADKDGYTSLHVACLRDPPLQVISSLLAAFPGATSAQNCYGNTPLHVASRYSGDDVIKALIESNMASIAIRNKDNHTPLQHLCDRQGNEINAVLERTLLPTDFVSSDLVAQDKRMHRIWNTACILIKASYHNSVNDSLPNGKTFRVLHACAGMKDCPSNVLKLAMQFQPNQLTEADEDGNLPLHIAAKLATEKEHDEFSVIEILITASPAAARVRNHDGKLPLQLAIESGKSRTILESYPEAIARDESKDSDICPTILEFLGREASLSSLFAVLRENPKLISDAKDHVTELLAVDKEGEKVAENNAYEEILTVFPPVVEAETGGDADGANMDDVPLDEGFSSINAIQKQLECIEQQGKRTQNFMITLMEEMRCLRKESRVLKEQMQKLQEK